MEQNQILAIDLLGLYIGVEHYNEYDEDGNLVECKSIETYFQQRVLSSDNICRRFLVNIETGDEIQIDQDGNCIKYISDDREIYDISGLYSFKDSVDELIRSTEHVVLCMPNGATSIEYFKTLSNHMHSAEQKGVPAYMEAEALDDLIESIANVYTLSYGNPLTQESKTRCLYNFNKHMEQYNRAKIMKFNPDK